MSNYQTWGEIKLKVQNDLDLVGADMIGDDEMLGYGNEAVREVESEIHTISEDYFLSRSLLTLISGQEGYSLPANIYAFKFRRVIYKNGSRIYTIDRLRDWHKFEKYTIETAFGAGTVYGYLIDNSTATDPKMVFTPTPTEDGPFVQLWYIREATRFVDDTTLCDIPEFVNFVIQYIKVRCYEKDIGNPNITKAMADLEQQRTQMVETLTAMVPDAENAIEADFSFYGDMT